jgi:hypothetical protein
MQRALNGLAYCYAYMLQIYHAYDDAYYLQQNHVITQQQNDIAARDLDIAQRDQIIASNITEMVVLFVDNIMSVIGSKKLSSKFGVHKFLGFRENLAQFQPPYFRLRK